MSVHSMKTLYQRHLWVRWGNFQHALAVASSMRMLKKAADNIKFRRHCLYLFYEDRGIRLAAYSKAPKLFASLKRTSGNNYVTHWFPPLQLLSNMAKSAHLLQHTHWFGPIGNLALLQPCSSMVSASLKCNNSKYGPNSLGLAKCKRLIDSCYTLSKC